MGLDYMKSTRVLKRLQFGNFLCHKKFDAFSFPFLIGVGGIILCYAYHHAFPRKLFSRAALRLKQVVYSITPLFTLPSDDPPSLPTKQVPSRQRKIMDDGMHLVIQTNCSGT
jgi:hypothetical protein